MCLVQGHFTMTVVPRLGIEPRHLPLDHSGLLTGSMSTKSRIFRKASCVPIVWVTYPWIPWLSHTNTPHTNLSKQLAAFPHGFLAHWWKTNDACRIDFLDVGQAGGLELTIPELTSPRRYPNELLGSNEGIRQLNIQIQFCFVGKQLARK